MLIQGFASRAFGVPISWAALTGRIPLVYISFLIPTLGNFGTREVAWAALFSEFGPRDALIAYAFSVNTVFLAINVLLGLIFLPRALSLVAAVRWARRGGDAGARAALARSDRALSGRGARSAQRAASARLRPPPPAV